MDQNTRRMDDPSNYHIDPRTLDPRDAALLYNVPCPKCGGIRLKTRAAAQSHMVVIYQPETHGLFDVPRCLTGAVVCLDCGYTELYTEDPRRLLRQPE